MNVRSVEHLSKKTKKNVQPAEVKTQKSDKPEEAKPQEIEVSLPFDISEDKIRLAEANGIPIRQMLQWMGTVEYRFQVVAKNVNKAPQEVVRLLKLEAMKGRPENMPTGQQPSGQQGKLGLTKRDLLQMVTGGGGGGGMDEEMQGLMKDMWRLNMDRMRQDMTNSMTSAKADAELSHALKNALAKEFAKKTAEKLLV